MFWKNIPIYLTSQSYIIVSILLSFTKSVVYFWIKANIQLNTISGDCKIDQLDCINQSKKKVTPNMIGIFFFSNFEVYSEYMNFTLLIEF